MSGEIESAYARCRSIAREQAKNFYYAFVALPRPKRNAICAVYAFMRRADDLSDDEALSIDARRAALDGWLSAWHEAEAAQSSSDPVFLALLDAQRRFSIPSSLLDQLVEGTAMDLRSPQPLAGEQVPPSYFATFADLYRYCYLVASVVGLVSIRIFGYSDPRAEKLAEETGVAFQLTNILRDVREDAERGRIYLPLEDLERCCVTPTEIPGLRPPLSEGQRSLLAVQAERAEGYYRAAHELLPLIAADSRPALWVLVAIYHRLLQRIKRRGYDVFTERVSVPSYEKMALLSRGMARILLNRLVLNRAFKAFSLLV